MKNKIIHFVGRISANARPHQLQNSIMHVGVYIGVQVQCTYMYVCKQVYM